MSKIQVLIDNGFITLDEVITYANDYTASYNQDLYEEQLAYELHKDHSAPEYVIASTSEMMEETMVFPADEHGDITSFSDLACIALRYGHEDWRNCDQVVSSLDTDEYTYEHVKCVSTANSNMHHLFKRVPKLITTKI